MKRLQIFVLALCSVVGLFLATPSAASAGCNATDAYYVLTDAHAFYYEEHVLNPETITLDAVANSARLELGMWMYANCSTEQVWTAFMAETESAPPYGWESAGAHYSWWTNYLWNYFC